MSFPKKLIHVVLSGIALAAAPKSKAQSVFTDWNFERLSTHGVDSDPATTTGTGTASDLGFSPDNSGIANQDSGTVNSDPTSVQEWKVRGTNNWNPTAAIASQGAQFSSSSAGYNAVTISFDWYPTTTGEANLLIQYTTDGTDWVDATSSEISFNPSSSLSVLTNSSNANIVNGAYLHATAGNTWYNDVTLNLSGVAAASGDSSLGIRLVDASTGTANVQATSGAEISTSSGNWGLDNVKFEGTAIPEPGTYALIVGAAALVFVAFRRRAAAAS